MEFIITPQKTLTFDVAVIGGGTAGVFAAKEKLAVSKVPYSSLCESLKEIGAIVPQ